MKTRKLNVCLLARVRRDILASPDRFDVLEDFENDISGFTAEAIGAARRHLDTFDSARAALRVSARDMRALCHLDRWPQRFQRAYEPEPTTRRHLRANARLAAARIECFMRTGA